MTLISEYLPIAEQDEGSGTIKTSTFKIQRNEYQKWADRAFLSPHGYGQLQLRLVPVGHQETKLEITTQFQGGTRSVFRNRGRYHHSTGVFEGRLAARIHTYVILKKYPKLIQLVTGCNFQWNEDIAHYEVSGVEAGSFGEAQGFQNGDIVIQVDGIDMTMENFFATLLSIEQTETKTFFVDRGGVGVLIEAKIFYLPRELPWFGFQTERDARTGRFQVTGVVPHSPAEHAGLEVGDLLLQEEEIALASWYDYYQAMSGARLGENRNFLVWREGKQQWITIRTE